MVETTMTILRPGKAAETRDASHLPSHPGMHRLRETLAVADILGVGVRPEHVSVLHEGRRADMFVDEDGVEKKLPMNSAATKIYRAATMRRDPDQDPKTLPAIYGTAVIFSRRVWF